MTVAAGCQTGNDAICNLLFAAYRVGEIVAIRGALVMLAVVAASGAYLARSWRTRQLPF
jgi:hypothetical protein